jgi:hypothetical protein
VWSEQARNSAGDMMCASASWRWKEEETMTTALQLTPLMVIVVVAAITDGREATVSKGK